MKFRNGLIIFMVLFMTFIVTLGVLMQREGSDLVSDDYYAHDRAYQNELQAIQNASSHKDAFNITQSADSLIFSFLVSPQPRKVSLYFMRPNNKAFDKSFELTIPSDLKMAMPKAIFKTGHYQVEAKYTIAGDHCLQRIDIAIK